MKYIGGNDGIKTDVTSTISGFRQEEQIKFTFNYTTLIFRIFVYFLIPQKYFNIGWRVLYLLLLLAGNEYNTIIVYYAGFFYGMEEFLDERRSDILHYRFFSSQEGKSVNYLGRHNHNKNIHYNFQENIYYSIDSILKIK